MSHFSISQLLHPQLLHPQLLHPQLPALQGHAVQNLSMNRSKTPRLLFFLGLIPLVLIVACGGKKAGSAGGAQEPDGAAVTSGGHEVSVQAHEHWLQGVALVEQVQMEQQQAQGEGAQGEGWTQERCRQAKRAFSNAADSQSRGFPDATYMVGWVSAQCGDAEGAQRSFQRAAEQDRHHCEAQTAAGVRLMNAGNAERAVRVFEAVIQADATCAPAYLNLAMIQRTQGKTKARDALNNIRRALAVNAYYLEAFDQMALLYLEQGQREKDDRYLDLATVVCRQAQLIDDNYAPIFNTWGLIFVERDNITEALRYFERAVQLDDDFFEAHMNFGQVTLSFRGYEDAKKSFKRATELRPQSYDAHIGLGVALRGLKEMDGAKSEYEVARSLDSRRPDAHMNLGILYQDHLSGSVDDLAQAKSHLEKFLELAGEQAIYRDAVKEVAQRCEPTRRRRRTQCRPGRLQNIETAMEALKAAAEAMAQMPASAASGPQ